MITLFDLSTFFISIQASVVSTEYAFFDHNKTLLFLVYQNSTRVFSCVSFYGCSASPSVFMFENSFCLTFSQLQTVGLHMTMRASQFTSPWCMTCKSKLFKTRIKDLMTVRTEVFKLLSIMKYQ